MVNTRKEVHVAMFSGGAASAVVANHIVQTYGKENCILFFTNTLWEDEDNYRFMQEVADYIGIEITERLDGRDPEQVFYDRRFLANSRSAFCSEELKVKQTILFIDDELINQRNLQPILYFGIGPDESHRADRLRESYLKDNCIEPIETRFPLIETFTDDVNVKKIIEEEWGIRLPRMYYFTEPVTDKEGNVKEKRIFKHANCAGRCIRGGFEHYKGLYNVWPHQYQRQEEMEERFRDKFNVDVSILKKNKKPYTLKRYREEILEKLDENNIQREFKELQKQDVYSDIPCICTYS
jgi:hypothetical protein